MIHAGYEGGDIAEGIHNCRLGHKKLISWFSDQHFQKQMRLGGDNFSFYFIKKGCGIFLFILTMCNSYSNPEKAMF